MNHTDVEMNRQGSSSTTLTGSHALSEAENEGSLCPIDAHKDRFPFCIVWTAIPCLTWFFPFVGHMAIADSQGIIYDFAGPYTIGKDDMAFGRPSRYIQLDPRKAKRSVLENEGSSAQNWDRAVQLANEIYAGRMHNLCCDNCHSHVARCLNLLKYDGKGYWNMIILAVWITFAGRFVSLSRTLTSYLPFCVFLSAILLWIML